MEYLLEKEQKIYCGCHLVFKNTIMCGIKKKEYSLKCLLLSFAMKNIK